MNYPDIYYLHLLNLVPQLGPKRLLLLAAAFDTFRQAFEADETALQKAGLEELIIATLIKHRTAILLDAEIEKLNQESIQLLCYTDNLYPRLLLETPSYPPLLYYRGSITDADELMIAMVGTRKISTYGRSVTPTLVSGLGTAGIVIVSGLAFGVDALVHQTCVDNHWRTIAVVGSGLDQRSVYPKQHQYLAEQIVATGGALISEYPIGTPAFKQNFVARNRIISGMSAGTVVVECNAKSGALITARHALDQNRSVYAVPGPIYADGSAGPHNLIRMGAQLITRAEHILEDLRIPISTSAIVSIHEFTPDQQMIIQHLSFDPVSADALVRQTSLDAATVIAILTVLEMEGVVRNLGAQQYVLAQSIKK